MTQRFAFCPWRFPYDATPDEFKQQQAFHDRLVATRRFALGEGSYVSPLAGLEVEHLDLGPRSFVAGFAYLTHRIVMGSDSTINPYAVVRGTVRIGDAVRIASHASIIGFNHNHDDLTRPMYKQDETSRGIVIGDDVWVGANAVVVDGVTIGSHAIVAAGAVVTRDVAEWQVVAGNPARPVRDRREPRRAAGSDECGEPAVTPPSPAVEATPVRRAAATSLESALASFGARVAEQWPAVIARCRIERGATPAFVDVPGTRYAGLRPLADAVEIAAMFGALPPSFDRDALVATLRSAQHPESGMPFEPDRPPEAGYVWDTLGDRDASYLILSAGYALECLGESFRSPLAAVHAMSPQRIGALMSALPWKESAWSAGAWVDSLGTAFAINQRRFGLDEPIAAVFDLLDRSCPPHTGLWGKPRGRDGWLQPVNGFYRLVRGTYATFGRPVPHPESAVDTVLAHVRQYGEFVERGDDACNVLDTVQPLAWLGRLTSHRRDDGLAYLSRMVPRLLSRWVDREGFGFAAGDPPGLQGTEMGLAIVATAAEALGLPASIGYAPRGVHRLDATLSFTR